MREIMANTVSLSFSVWSHFHHLEVNGINEKFNRLYNGDRTEYNLYHKLILDKFELYGHEDTKDKRELYDKERLKKPQLKIPLHETQLYPAIVEHSTAAGVSISSFMTGILAGGFLMWPNINDNARQDMIDVFKPLEERFRERVAFLLT